MALIMAVAALDNWLGPSRNLKWASLAMLLVGAIFMSPWVHLPVGREFGQNLRLAFLIIGSLVFVLMLPSWVRQIKASARS